MILIEKNQSGISTTSVAILNWSTHLLDDQLGTVYKTKIYESIVKCHIWLCRTKSQLEIQLCLICFTHHMLAWEDPELCWSIAKNERPGPSYNIKILHYWHNSKPINTKLHRGIQQPNMNNLRPFSGLCDHYLSNYKQVSSYLHMKWHSSCTKQAQNVKFNTSSGIIV